MKKSACLITVLLLGSARTAVASADCKDPEIASAFLAYGSGSRDFTQEDVKVTFTPVAECLQRWVEDGGEADGLPLQQWAKGFQSPRAVYMAKAMELIDALVLLEAIRTKHELASWIRTSVGGWSGPVKWNAWKTLADLHDHEAIPLLRLEAARSEGVDKTFAWEQLARLSPETAAADLEKVARSEEDYKALGFALLSADSPSVIPALRRLIQLDPGKASRYRGRIDELERGGTTVGGRGSTATVDDAGFRRE